MERFEMFSAQHWISIMMFGIIGFLVIAAAKKSKSSQVDFTMRLLVSAVLWFFFITLRVYRIADGSFSASQHLPIHLCGFSAALMPIMLFRKNKKLYETLYFWGVGGATQSMLTPTLEHAFPHFYYFEFFSTHAFIIIGALYVTIIDGYRPTLKGLFRTYLITCLMLIPIGFVNWLLDANYFFVAGKPETASLIDFLGPWPFYLFPLSIVALIIFFIIYFPFPLLAYILKRTR